MSGGKPLQEMVSIVCDLVCIFEFVLYFVRCDSDSVTKSNY